VIRTAACKPSVQFVTREWKGVVYHMLGPRGTDDRRYIKLRCWVLPPVEALLSWGLVVKADAPQAALTDYAVAESQRCLIVRNMLPLFDGKTPRALRTVASWSCTLRGNGLESLVVELAWLARAALRQPVQACRRLRV